MADAAERDGDSVQGMRSCALAIAVLGLAACGVFEGNHAPKIEPVTAMGKEDLGVGVTFVATDEDGDDLQMSIDSFGGNAEIVQVQQTHDGDTSRLEMECVVRAGRGFYGELVLFPKVSDGTATTEGEATITFESVEDPPYAEDDAIAARVNTPAVIRHSTLLANDWDGDDQGDQRTPLSITKVGGPLHGTVVLGAETITFTPEPDFVGVAGISYTVSDGVRTNPGQALIMVGGANDAPVPVDDQLGTFEDQPLVVATRELTANDFDAERQSLEVIAVANPTHGTVELSGDTITFTKDSPGFFGEAGFDYTVSDGVDVGTAHAAVFISPYE